jgi:hypothetical protein
VSSVDYIELRDADGDVELVQRVSSFFDGGEVLVAGGEGGLAIGG